MTLRNLINKLERLSQGGKNDYLPVVFPNGEWELYPEFISVNINQDPTYNFDESNDAPYMWVELDIDIEDKKRLGLL